MMPNKPLLEEKRLAESSSAEENERFSTNMRGMAKEKNARSVIGRRQYPRTLTVV
jgi:hypothetical protein